MGSNHPSWWRNPDLKILFWFLSLNVLFFLPLAVLDFEKTAFFPVASFLHVPWFEFFRAGFVRPNFDLFRLSVDLLLLVLLFVFLRKRVPARHYRWILFPAFLALLGFSWYTHVFLYLFQLPPALYSDLRLLLLSMDIIAMDGPGWIVLGGLILVAAGFGLFFWISRGLHWIEHHRFRRLHALLLLLLALPLLLSVYRFGIRRMKPENTFQVASFFVLQNIKASLSALRHEEALAKMALDPNTPYPLSDPPNIYFLIVESYGSFALDHDAGGLADRLASIDAGLQEDGWHAVSAWSESPVFGGGSSTAFATILFGLNFHSFASYYTALRDPRFIASGHLLNRLAETGYTHYRLSSIPPREMKIPWETYSAFFAIDEWIKFEDLDYAGKLYGFGPSPPDQFSLEKARVLVQQTTTRPYTLFQITQNSHSPYAYPPLAAAWEELNDGSQERIRYSSFLTKPEPADYWKAMDYQLQMLAAFIRNETEPAIFILIGDHQPPFLANREDGFFTPVHVIARDPDLLSALPAPFRSGMLPGDQRVLRHEDFKGYFEAALLATFPAE